MEVTGPFNVVKDIIEDTNKRIKGFIELGDLASKKGNLTAMAICLLGAEVCQLTQVLALILLALRTSR